MSEAIARPNAALEGRYRIESELGEGGMATVGQQVLFKVPLALARAIVAGSNGPAG